MSWDDIQRSQTFAILGAGSGGKATAAYLAHAGYRVNLYGRDRDSIGKIAARGAIDVTGVISGRAEIKLATNDLPRALEDADVIVIAVPGHVQHKIAAECAGFLRNGQIIVLTPGRVFGAWEFRTVCQRQGLSADVTIAETQTVPFTCRSNRVLDVQLLAVKKRVKLAALPASRTVRVLSSIGDALPMLDKALNILETGLNSIGSILHPLPTLMNLGWIETERADFKHYYDGISPSVARLLEQLDGERIAVGNALNVPMFTVQEWLKDVYSARGETLYEAIRDTACYETIDAPRSIDHRYLYEDVPTGLVPLASLAAVLDVPAPMMNLAIDLACSACAVDFRRQGRTLRGLQIASVSSHEFRRALTE